MQLEKVLVVLVNYNTSELVPDVLKSIDESEVEVSILLVDNGSSVEDYEELKKLSDVRLHLLRLEKNVGFVKGNNIGIQYAMEKFNDFQYIFLLNTDAYIKPNLIGGLKKILDANSNAACISPKIFSRDGRTWYGGSSLNFKKGSVTSTVNIDEKKPSLFYKVDVFNGCAVLFRLDRFLQAGMLNEKLFMYYEEADSSLRIKELGYDILYAPGFDVLHDVSYSTRKVSYLKTYYMTRNKFMLFNQTMPLNYKVYYLAHEFAFHVKNKRFKNAFYHLKAFIDFKRGKVGKVNA